METGILISRQAQNGEDDVEEEAQSYMQERPSYQEPGGDESFISGAYRDPFLHVLDKLAEIRGWTRDEAEARTENAFFDLFHRSPRP